MVDVFTKEKRSEVMSRIRGKGNKDTELLVVKIFQNNHITGWRRNQPVLGKPDFVFYKVKLAIFVDGCFWHCCPDHSKIPENNQEFWRNKLKKNLARDAFINEALSKKGWTVMRIWEHELKNPRLVVDRLLPIIHTDY